MSADGWVQRYRAKGALWLHDGDPRRPHTLLTSGNHSGGYFNSKLVTEDAALLAEAARDLVSKLLHDAGFDIGAIDSVVGPQTGATRLAESVAREITTKRGRACVWTSPAKVGEGREKAMVFTDTKVSAGEKILLVEDVLNTGGSVELAAKAALDRGGVVLPFAAVLVNRSGAGEVGGRKIISLIDHPMPIWAPEACPLCRAGSAPSPKRKLAEAHLVLPRMLFVCNLFFITDFPLRREWMTPNKGTEERKALRARANVLHVVRRTMDKGQFATEGYAAELEELRRRLTAVNEEFRRRERERQEERARKAS